MKKIIISLIVLCCVMAGKAQNEVLSAILQTGGEVTMFTGPGAFNQAISNAADEGSVITLSPGTFDAPGIINKSFTVYGAGWEEDADNGISMITTINGNLRFATGYNPPSLKNIWLEGLYVNGYIKVGGSPDGIVINKCRFAGFDFGYANPSNVTLRRCYVQGDVGGQMATITNMTGENCFIEGCFDLGNGTANQVHFDHCIFYKNGYGSRTPAFYTNCILYKSGVGGGSTLKNCICTFQQPTNSLSEGCWFGIAPSTIFSDGTSFDYSATRTYELNDPTYVGTDGKAVGVSDGNFPWNKVPATPVVKSLQLGVDGQDLNVTYEAEVR